MAKRLNADCVRRPFSQIANGAWQLSRLFGAGEVGTDLTGTTGVESERPPRCSGKNDVDIKFSVQI